MGHRLPLERLPTAGLSSPTEEDLNQARKDVELLNNQIRHAELHRYLIDTNLRSNLVYIFSGIIFLWLAAVISILYFNYNLLELKLSDTVLVTLITTTTINVIGMMLIILRNLFPIIDKKNKQES